MNVKELRLQTNMSQRAFADMFGIPINHLAGLGAGPARAAFLCQWNDSPNFGDAGIYNG